jgi:pectate lyase
MRFERKLLFFYLVFACSIQTLVFAEGEGYGENNGGNSGDTVTVYNATDFIQYAQSGSPYVILVSGTIDLGDGTNVNSNKTISGINSQSSIIGELKLNGVKNVIIKFLNITNPIDGDGISLRYSSNVFINHCSVYDCSDGLIDITRESDSVTVSYCKFYYKIITVHKFPNLIGASDDDLSDRGKLHVTFHHNWWAEGCVSRMPNVRFGRVHMYNNYFTCTGNNYCSRARIEAQILSEYNYYEKVRDPLIAEEGGLAKSFGNVYIKCTNTIHPGNDIVFTPNYAYSCSSPDSAREEIILLAGNTEPWNFKAGLTRVSHENQKLVFEKDQPIEPLVYAWTNADAVGFTGLPSGLVAAYDLDLKLITFTGAPKDTGTYILTLNTINGIENSTLSDTLKIIIPDMSSTAGNISATYPEFLIYPNPANNQLFIDFKSVFNEDMEIQIADISGEIVSYCYSITRETNIIEFDIADLAPGLYFLYIQNSLGFSKPIRFIKL